jgi:hypothetical protein
MAETKDCYNMNIAGLVNRINRFLVELMKSQSANITNWNDFDQDRLKTYIDNVETYLDWVVAQPLLDLPETTPMLVALNPFPETGPMESDMITDMSLYMQRMRDELLHSQSSRQGTGVIDFDEIRCRAIIKAVRAFMADYVASANPVDLPESTPSDPVTGHGSRGV